jgi:hypothetical protein
MKNGAFSVIFFYNNHQKSKNFNESIHLGFGYFIYTETKEKS